MKVRIGNYRRVYSIYDLLKPLKHVGVSQEKRDAFEEWLEDTWFAEWFYKTTNWIYEKRNRRIKVCLDPWDTYSMDNTLALIIHPMLVQLKATNHGYFFVDDEDIPEELVESLNDVQRYEYVMDEMIWTFKSIKIDEIDYFEEKDHSRLKNGLRLFGKYYLTLWD